MKRLQALVRDYLDALVFMLTASLVSMAQGVFSPAQAAGVGRLASRKEWPLEVLKQVLTALMREVPRTLLERQVWSGSCSASDWWRRQQHHSRSAAVMSMQS